MTPARVPGPQPGPALYLLGTYVRTKANKLPKLKQRRVDKGLTQKQLGALCNETSQAAISMLESGRMSTCTEELALLVCKWLDIDLEDYFDVRSDIPAPGVPTDQQVTRRRPGRRGGRPKGWTAKPSPERVA